MPCLHVRYGYFPLEQKLSCEFYIPNWKWKYFVVRHVYFHLKNTFAVFSFCLSSTVVCHWWCWPAFVYIMYVIKSCPWWMIGHDTTTMEKLDLLCMYTKQRVEMDDEWKGYYKLKWVIYFASPFPLEKFVCVLVSDVIWWWWWWWEGRHVSLHRRIHRYDYGVMCAY